MKRQKLIKLLSIALVSLLIFSGCAAKEETVMKSESREELKTAVNEFYGDLLKEEHVKMSSTLGSSTSEFTVDCDKMYYNDQQNGFSYYLFTDNGRKYVMYEGGEPVEDESMYDMSKETISTTLSLFVTGYFDIDDEALKFSGTDTKKGNTETLVTVIEVKEDEQNAKLTVTGTKENGKVTNIAYLTESEEGNSEYNFDFNYNDCTVQIPSYEIPEPRVYKHVEPRFTKVQELINLLDDPSMFHYTMDGERDLYVMNMVDGRAYQYHATLSDEDVAAVMALDFFADDYSEKVVEIFAGLDIDDCIDFTEYMLSEDELNALIGKTLGELYNNGFEQSGYSVYEDVATAYGINSLAEYKIDLNLQQPFAEDAEIDIDDLLDLTVKDISFESFSFSQFPLK